MGDAKESVVKVEEQGNIHISEDVVASIAALAVSEVEGVASLVNTSSSVADLIGKKSLSRGVKLSIDGTKVNVDAFVMIKYGYAIVSVAQKAQEGMKNAIESMAGLEVGELNIHVSGITFDKEPKK